MVREPLLRDPPDEAAVELWRQLGPAGRLRLVGEMWEAAETMLRAHLAAEHPEWGEETLTRAVAARLAGEAG